MSLPDNVDSNAREGTFQLTDGPLSDEPRGRPGLETQKQGLPLWEDGIVYFVLQNGVLE